MVPKSNLASLMEYIGSRYIFDGKNYPGYDRLSNQEKKLFAVRHSLLHISKSIGRIAAEAEAADHGIAMNHGNLQIDTTKMLINVIKLAEELGMSGKELAAKVPEVMFSR